MEIKGHKLASFAKQKRRYFQHLVAANSYKGIKTVCLCVCVRAKGDIMEKKSQEKTNFPPIILKLSCWMSMCKKTGIARKAGYSEVSLSILVALNYFILLKDTFLILKFEAIWSSIAQHKHSTLHWRHILVLLCWTTIF